MTPTVERAPLEPATDVKVIGLIGAAHFVSHFYILMLAPLFAVIRADFGVSYTQLGLALAAFNTVSAIAQTPTGILVDRVSARAVLIGGLLVGAMALAGAAALPSFWGFVAMFGLLGLANTVYHPADYALLSRHISPNRMGQAYSIHTFAGMVGSAAAPPLLLLLGNLYGWRGAYLISAALGVAVAAVLAAFGSALSAPSTSPAAAKPIADAGPASNKELLLSSPILLNLAFFILLAIFSAGIQNFSVVALQELRGTPLVVSNTALSAYLAFSALGVLVGGFVAMRTARHDGVAIAGLVVFAISILLVAFIDVNAALLIALIGVAGLCNGIIMPSRDMLVRAVTPPGAFGTVFGFVTNGFSIGGIVTPFIFGWLMDHGSPRGVFLASVAFCIAAIPIVILNRPRRTN